MTETRRALREMSDRADRAIDEQVGRLEADDTQKIDGHAGRGLVRTCVQLNDHALASAIARAYRRLAQIWGIITLT